MNRKQKTVLLCTAAIIAIMVLFPPYVVKNYRGVVIRSGYGFLFDLPPYIQETSYVENPAIPATLNIPTLLIEVMGALIVGGLIHFAFRKEDAAIHTEKEMEKGDRADQHKEAFKQEEEERKKLEEHKKVEATQKPEKGSGILWIWAGGFLLFSFLCYTSYLKTSSKESEAFLYLGHVISLLFFGGGALLVALWGLVKPSSQSQRKAYSESQSQPEQRRISTLKQHEKTVFVFLCIAMWMINGWIVTRNRPVFDIYAFIGGGLGRGIVSAIVSVSVGMALYNIGLGFYYSFRPQKYDRQNAFKKDFWQKANFGLMMGIIFEIIFAIEW